MIEFIIVNKSPYKDIIVTNIIECMYDYNKILNKDYKIKCYDKYNKSFENSINKSAMNNKIYFLNISCNTPENKNKILQKIYDKSNTQIILTTKNNIDYFSYLSKYTFDIISEKDSKKFGKSIYKIIKIFNTYNNELLKLNIKENGVLHIINVDDIISINKTHINNLLLIKTKYFEITTQLDYTYLKNNLPSNFKNVNNVKIINTDYEDPQIINKNTIIVSQHTRNNYSNINKEDLIKKYKNGKITLNDIRNLNIKIPTFYGWLRKYNQKNKIDVKINIETN